MADIKMNLVIKAAPEKVFQAVSTQEGIQSWWCKQTTAKPEIGFTNIFVFGSYYNEMPVTKLVTNKLVEWDCTKSIEEWVGTTVSFDLEEKEGKTLLRFTHGGYKTVTDTFCACTYDWGRFMTSLKTYCETGTGTPA
jgi:uncharacterized protein YndB with AHSA1/START domain